MTPINQPIAEQGRVVSVGDYVRGNIREYGMSIHGLGTDSQQMVKGAVLLAAVFFDVYNKNKG